MSADQDQRRRAIEETDRSFIVEASAGTGKTTVLIRRILHCVLQQGPAETAVPLSRICAITFTEKAAGEMKIRLRQEFESRSADRDETGARARQALIDLESAAISTFHSFAVSLLKERPIEAALDPRFTALDEVQSELLFREVWEAWLERAIQQRDPRLEQVLRAGMSLEALRSVARTLRLHAHEVRRLTFPPPPTEEETQSQVEDLRQEGARWRIRMLDPGDKLLPYLDRVLQWLQAPSAADPPARPGGAGAAANWDGGKDTVSGIQNYVRGVVAFAHRYRRLPTQRIVHAAARWLIDDLLSQWEERKRERGLLEFDDQLWCAYELLASSRAARQEFRQRYAVLLVDEFQDTDPVQWEIIRLLASDEEIAGPKAGKIAPGRLFIVGDPKQSIYRFRGADIETYRMVARAESMTALGLERLELTTNFRSVPPILEFVDCGFSAAMRAEEGKLYQTEYLAFGGCGARIGQPGTPSVYLLGDRLENGAPAGSGPEYAAREAQRIANLILRICGRTGWLVDAGADLPGRSARLRDIAILLPVLTHADVLEAALRDAGIPYVLEGGKFYYARSEVSSAVSVLRSISNPNDRLSLYGALRSIFFGLSDEDLLRAKTEGVELDYRREVSAGSLLHRPYRLLAELHLMRNQRPASETLECLFRQTGAREVLAARSAQSLANLNKLVRTLRALQQDATFSEVVEWVGKMDEEGIAESESRIMEERSNAVRVLTIHRAKGLDFPVVIVAGLGTQRKSRPADFLADPHGDKSFAISLGSKEAGLCTHLWEELAEMEKEREEAELKRLLYVAFTRARDYLILSTHTRGKAVPEAEALAPAFEKTRWKPLGAFLGEACEGERPLARFLDADALMEPIQRQPAAPAVPEVNWQQVLTARYHQLHRLISETPHARGLRAASAFTEGEKDGDLLAESARDRAVRLGNAFHEAMERVDFAGAADVQALAGDAGARQRLDEAGVRELEAMLRQSLESRLMERVRHARLAGGRIWRELPYVRPLDSVQSEIEEGTIDLLFEESGAWVLADYKTDQIPKEAADPTAYFVEKYLTQMQAYVVALQTLGIQVRSACLLLARTGMHIEMPLAPAAGERSGPP